MKKITSWYFNGKIILLKGTPLGFNLFLVPYLISVGFLLFFGFINITLGFFYLFALGIGILIISNGRNLGSWGVKYLIGMLFWVGLSWSMFILYKLVLMDISAIYITYGTWFEIGDYTVCWEMIFDKFNTLFIFVIMIISFCVFLYSCEYMQNDPHQNRFFLYIGFFNLCMIILVSAEDLVQLFIGWEGVGLCSYLLVNFWYTRIAANKAALKALLINRIGDCGLLLGIFITAAVYKTTNISLLSLLMPLYASSDIFLIIINWQILLNNVIGICLLIGVIGKSAQLGLHTWLPDAMEGPTPVSALIHAATMVTAGVYLLLKFSFLFVTLPLINIYIVLFGSITALVAATIGLLQNDLKKIIAYSTCSQLGYMVLSAGNTNYIFSFYHLINHAFFKALLFLGAGAILHSLSNEQDIRQMGGLRFLLPLSYVTMFIGSIAIIGTPFFAGYYSKDAIIEWTLSQYNIVSYFSTGTSLLAAFCTCFYSVRLLLLVFYQKPRGPLVVYQKIHENSFLINSVLCFLSLNSIFIGYLLRGWCNSITLGRVLITPTTNSYIDFEFTTIFIKQLPNIGLILMLALTLYFYLASAPHTALKQITIKKIYKFLYYKWFFDLYYNTLAIYHLYSSYNLGFLIMEKGLLEVIGPTGFSSFIKKLNFWLTKVEAITIPMHVWWLCLTLFWWFSYLALMT